MCYRRAVTLCCSTVSFRGSLAQAVGRVAGLGFTHADLVAIPYYRQALPEEMVQDPARQAAAISAALAEAGIKPATFNAAVGDLDDRSPAAMERRAREWNGLAAVMEALHVRIASFYPGYLKQGDPWHEALDRIAASAAEMLAVARSRGVEFLLEAHYDTPVATPDQLRALIAAMPALRFVYDPSHFAMQGLDPAETEFLLDRTAHVHVRDAAPGKMSVMGGTGTVDFGRLLTALRERRYRGYVALECLPPDTGEPDHDILAVKRLVEAALQ